MGFSDHHNSILVLFSSTEEAKTGDDIAEKGIDGDEEEGSKGIMGCRWIAWRPTF